mgnify:CR=1 FL=1
MKPSKLTPEAQETICRLTREGKFLSAAATKAGVHRDTVYGWLERGEADPPAEGDEIYVEFARAFRDAEADMEVWAIEQICEKVKGWQAIAWLLERRWPARYSARALVQHEHTGKIQHEHTHDADALLARINALAAQCAADPTTLAASEGAAVDDGAGTPSIIN